jgi:hypothetical protein
LTSHAACHEDGRKGDGLADSGLTSAAAAEDQSGGIARCLMFT